MGNSMNASRGYRYPAGFIRSTPDGRQYLEVPRPVMYDSRGYSRNMPQGRVVVPARPASEFGGPSATGARRVVPSRALSEPVGSATSVVGGGGKLFVMRPAIEPHSRRTLYVLEELPQEDGTIRRPPVIAAKGGSPERSHVEHWLSSQTLDGGPATTAPTIRRNVSPTVVRSGATFATSSPGRRAFVDSGYSSRSYVYGSSSNGRAGTFYAPAPPSTPITPAVTSYSGTGGGEFQFPNDSSEIDEPDSNSLYVRWSPRLSRKVIGGTSSSTVVNDSITDDSGIYLARRQVANRAPSVQSLPVAMHQSSRFVDMPPAASSNRGRGIGGRGKRSKASSVISASSRNNYVMNGY